MLFIDWIPGSIYDLCVSFRETFTIGFLGRKFEEKKNSLQPNALKLSKFLPWEEGGKYSTSVGDGGRSAWHELRDAAKNVAGLS